MWTWIAEVLRRGEVEVLWIEGVPCVCDDYVVEGRVLLAEAGEADS